MSRRNSHNAQDVFTPTTPARLTFVEREAVNNKLVNALRTPGKQIIVYGHSGSGKTTLVENKLYQIYEGHIKSHCMKNITFEQLLLDAFDQLGNYYEIEQVKSGNISSSSSISTEYAGIKAQISSRFDQNNQSKNQRILPPQLTPQNLARFLGEARCCWVIDDFHKVEDSEKIKLAQIMKIFMDMADDYRYLKIIALGAVDTARQVIEADAEMRNRVSEIFVPLMDEKEIKEIIDKGEELLNFKMKTYVQEGIVRYSNGLPSICHQICLNICYATHINSTLQERGIIEEENLQDALEEYIKDASDTLKSAFDRAFRIRRTSGKYDNAKLIVEALTKFNQDGAIHGDILSKIRKENPGYPSGNLTYYLKRLQTDEWGAILRHDTYSGKFSFADPIYRAFAMTIFEKDKVPTSHNTRHILDNVDLITSDIMVKLLENIQKFVHEHQKISQKQ